MCRRVVQILVLQPQTEPGPRNWKPRDLTTGPPGNSQYNILIFFPWCLILLYPNIVKTTFQNLMQRFALAPFFLKDRLVWFLTGISGGYPVSQMLVVLQHCIIAVSPPTPSSPVSALPVLGLRHYTQVFSGCSDGGCSSLWCVGFPWQRLLLLPSTGSVVAAQGLRCSAACAVFPGQAPKLCPSTGRQMLLHWTTRAVPRASSVCWGISLRVSHGLLD